MCLRSVAALPLLLAAWIAMAAAPMRFPQVTVFLPLGATQPEQMAARMLVEEVERRSGLHWRLQIGGARQGTGNAMSIVLATGDELKRLEPSYAGSAIARPRAPARPESFRIHTLTVGQHSMIVIEGHDARGVLFGTGYLLRQLEMTVGSVELSGGLPTLDTAQSPVYAVRGFQLGYRPKNNTFDGWTAAQFEQYIRDLAVFGANTIELIPPRSDDVASSPLFLLPPLQMMQSISTILQRYGLDCSIWYPAMDKDYSNPATVDRAVKEWGVVFQALPKVDAVFVPGGDPGHTEPKYLFRLLEREAAELGRYHPHAQMWVSPQSFDAEWLEEFYQLLGQHPKWLTGVIYGPEMRVSPEAFRQRVPREYPIRFYPDITHTLASQYPVPDWDTPFALTEGREPINPEPVQQGVLFHRYMPYSIGFVAYSEGSNDDVNKVLWSAWGWDPGQPSARILQQYARYFLSPKEAGTAASAMAGLERNWQGPIVANASIAPTLREFQTARKALGSTMAKNWRMHQLVYRADYDAYLQDRARRETWQEAKSVAALRSASQTGAQPALERAKAILAPAAICEQSPLCEGATFLAADLFHTVRMQLSVTRFGALAVDRGANLDRIDAPIGDRPWLLDRIAVAEAMATEAEKRRSIAATLAELDPRGDLIVDEMGPFEKHPHLLPGSDFFHDPSGLRGVYFSANTAPPAPAEPLFARTFAGTLYDYPLTMHYSHLKPGARYHVHIVYPSSGDTLQIRVNGVVFAQQCARPRDCTTSELDSAPVPSSGELTLQWNAPPGLGGNGRTVKVSRVVVEEVP
jgi:hypothetical protein